MPRNGSGTYSLPAGNPVEPNTTIETEWANTTLEDVGNELTNSLSRTGEGGMLAPLRFDDGTDSVPGMAWLTETSSGFYREGTAEFWATVLAEPVLQFTDNGVLVPSGKTFTVQGTQINSGSLDVTGNFAVNTDKFTVAAASGNTVVAGTLGVTGAITATGGVNGNITTSSATITGGTINGTAIGGSTAAAGAFTTLSASGGITGALTGNVTGNLTGNVTGNVSGNAGTVTNGVYTTGSYSNPAWITSLAGSKITGNISGNAAGLSATLAIASGGTNATTEAGARANLLPSYSTNALKFLRVNSGGTDVEWATEPSLGTVTSVNASGGTTGMSFTGGPVTSSGTLTMSGTLAVANGGTGSANASDARTALGVAIGTDVPSPTGTGASGTWSIGISGNAGTVTNGVYTSGSYSDPAWITSLAGSKITGNISGNAGGLSSTLAVGSGGTGQTTYTDGQLLIGNSTGNTLTKATLTAGSGITVTNGNGSITIASTAGGGSVTSVDVSGGTTGLTTSGGPVTTSGTITLGGTLAVANGGTGATSLTTGYLVKGNGTSAASASVVYDDGTNVGIGTAVPTVKLDVAQAQNAESRVALTNSSSGTSASSAYLLSNGTHTAVARLYGASYTTSGIFRQGGMLLYNDGPGGITIDTGAAQPIYFGIDNAERMRIGTAGEVTATNTSANALAVGRQGATNPVLNVDASTASVVTGLNLKGAAAAGGMALSVTSSGTNENLTIDAKGSGTVTINGTATGGITLSRAVTMSSTATATAFIPSGSSIPTDGMYLPSANLVSISSANTRVARFFYSSGANWGAFGGFAFVAGNANGSYPVGGFGCRPTGTANTYTYDQSDSASFIQYSGGISTYTAASGTVGNTISPTAGPYVANLGTSWTNSSDARLKDQFTALSGVLDKLANIVVGTYVWSGQGQSPAGRADLGIRAQELYAQFPLLVDKGDDSPTWDSETSQRWGINESKVGVVALQAVKELLVEVRLLSDRITALENK